jgi:opine dehydrogenase
VYRALSGDPRLVLEGAVRAECRLGRVGRWSAASAARFLADAEIVAVGLSASGFDEALPLIITSLTDGQHLSIFPAFHGAQKAVGMCETLPSPPDITIAEAASYPTYTVWDGEHTLHVQSVKRSLQLAVSPFERLEGEIAYYRSYFSIFTPAQSFLETSLGNINVVLHPLPILLNLAAVERNAAGFRHFIDGFSPRVGMAAEKLDAERVAVGRALGVELLPALEQLKHYYGPSDVKELYRYVNDPCGPYGEVCGFGLDSRYITEDIPYLLLPLLELGEKAGVPMPAAGLCLRLAEIAGVYPPHPQ